MMFGLPGACLAMYRTARSDKRKAVGGLLISMALTSFLTGVTEPIEFSFMFLAPLLFGLHALLTGVAMVLMHMLGVHLGFGFSAGLFDYVLNFSRSTHPWMLLPVGLLYFGVYYGLFRFFIVRFDLRTLGREPDDAVPVAPQPADTTPALAWIRALGSAANLRSVEACTTRLRLVVIDGARLDEPLLKTLGARGVLRLGDGAVQVVVGPVADQLASEIRQTLRDPAASPGELRLTPPTGDAGAPVRALAALGGKTNLAEVTVTSSRVCVTVHDPARVDSQALAAAVRAVARPTPARIHLIVGPAATDWRARMTD
jgi:PTS system N-acetylglucosamine-specific IIC component